ncbi:retrovirus-related pol polyprotein from transposon TNT 1-94 [Tanacetum coccineum]
MTCAQHADKDMYSASAFDIAVQSCFLDDQLTSFSPRNYIPPDMLLQSSWHPAWSAPEYAISSNPESFEYHKPMLMVNDINADDVNIKPVYDEEPMAEDAEQCHDTRPLLAKLTDNKTTELSNQSLKSKNIWQHGHFLKAKSNEAKGKKDIDDFETINIKLEYNVAKLLKENKTLKKHYKELYDSIKTTRANTIERTTSLIAQNVEFKAQLPEKRKSTCFVRDLQGNDLLSGTHGSDLYTITLQDLSSPTPICLLAKASPTQAWLWHRRLSHLNFDTINLLSKNEIMNGLPKLKFVKDQLCSSCKVGKAKRSSFKTIAVTRLKKRLDLLHMDLWGPMRVKSINGKKYIMVIVDDYSRYTWTHFLRSKDETP